MKLSSRVIRYPLLIIAAVFLCAAVVAGAGAAGTSDVSTTASVPSDTVTITSVNDLIAFQKSVNNGTFAGGTVKLMADLNLAGRTWSPIGTIEHPFEGTFDGNGHTISGVNIKSNGTIIHLFFNEYDKKKYVQLLEAYKKFIDDNPEMRCANIRIVSWYGLSLVPNL